MVGFWRLPEEVCVMAPTFANGKICYIELPAKNIESSAAFYREVFGWKVRKRGDGSTAFDDGVGEVSGTWVEAREPMAGDPHRMGPLIYNMVNNAEATLAKVEPAGGEIVQALGAQAPEITAWFKDPGGNVLGIYQQRG